MEYMLAWRMAIAKDLLRRNEAGISATFSLLGNARHAR
jgi:hypothetical protein